MNFVMATLSLKEMGKFVWEGREKSLPSWLSQFSKTNIYTVPGLVKAEISINQEGNSVLRIKLEYIYKYMRFFS